MSASLKTFVMTSLSRLDSSPGAKDIVIEVCFS